MSKHTPGPWVTAKGSHRFFIQTEAGASPKEAIAEIWSSYNSKEESAANAKLIAASPKMLEALESVFLRCTFEHVVDWREERRVIGEIIGQAIVEARGRK